MSNMRFKQWGILCLSIIFPSFAHGQLKGDHILGDAGLQSGTQATPNLSIAVPVYWYDASKLKNKQGNVIADQLKLNMFFTGIGFSAVTPWKILGANYGASLILPFASNRLESTVTDIHSSFAFSDIYVQPVQLGWHIKQADFLFGYALYIPSGKYEPGGDDNAGLGQWVNEFSGGTTVFFDKKKLYHFSALGSYAVNSKKKDTDIQTGNNLSIEGGFGKTWYAGIKSGHVKAVINAGPVYYMQYKITADKIPLSSGWVLDPGKDQIYAIGVEGNIFITKIRSMAGFRWLGELGARNRIQGNTFMLTLGYMIKSLEGEKKE
jgi:hypothetical protein